MKRQAMPMRAMKKLAIEATGNAIAQEMLDKFVHAAHCLMGVGYGRSVDASGERGVLNFLKRNYTAPFCIVDVGANKGQYLSLVLECLSGYPLDVHCFEPSANAFRALQEGYGGREHIWLNNFGLGKEATEKPLYYTIPGATTSSLIQRHLSHLADQGKTFDRSEQVRIDRLDSYCKRRGIEKIHLLKIDVEGFEMDVLEGACDMFANDGVEIVSFEFGSHQIERCLYFHDFYLFFECKNMKLYRITPSGHLHPMGSYRVKHEQFATSNYLAVRQS